MDSGKGWSNRFEQWIYRTFEVRKKGEAGKKGQREIRVYADVKSVFDGQLTEGWSLDWFSFYSQLQQTVGPIRKSYLFAVEPPVSGSSLVVPPFYRFLIQRFNFTPIYSKPTFKQVKCGRCGDTYPIRKKDPVLNAMVTAIRPGNQSRLKQFRQRDYGKLSEIRKEGETA